METIFENNGGTYTQVGDYLLPNLSLPTEEKETNIGVWAMRHKRYLKQSHKVRYYNLLTSGKLDLYLADIEEQAENESRSMNIRIGLRNHALNGSSGNYRKRLYGYVKDDDGNLVIEPTQAQVVRDIYRWYIDGQAS